MHYDNKNILILGGGISGVAAALLLLSKGSKVTLADCNSNTGLSDALMPVAAAGGKLYLGHAELPDEYFDLCVASPVFAPDHDWITACRARGLKIISELELGAAYWENGIIAITGSKGKSSVVKLCADTMNIAGIPASPAGNYGVPLSKLALEKPDLMWAVTEVSSFQMENTCDMKPDLSILLNLQPDHLNRHGTMALYESLKLKMFSAMSAGSPALLPENFDDSTLQPENLNVIRFGKKPDSQWCWQNGLIKGSFKGDEVYININGSWFDNEIFGIAASAASAALVFAGLSAAQIETGFQKFVPLEHRMESFLCSRKGVNFINDSKATTLSAMVAALKMVKTPVMLIAGGLLKENLSENIKELLTHGTKKVYLIGDCCEQMFKAWSGTVLCVECGTLEEAVSVAVREAEPGETVMLSPGTASFDQFKNYCERGERFKELVRMVTD